MSIENPFAIPTLQTLENESNEIIHNLGTMTEALNQEQRASLKPSLIELDTTVQEIIAAAKQVDNV